MFTENTIQTRWVTSHVYATQEALAHSLLMIVLRAYERINMLLNARLEIEPLKGHGA